MNIKLHQINMVPYSAAGNITPVVDLSMFGFQNLKPNEVRTFLEGNVRFRKWLRKNGKDCRADTVMIYYKANHPEYDYVTFIGEPNADINSAFSDMCGNGIRSLTLHLCLETDNSKFFIYAGNVIKTKIRKISGNSANVEVNMGRYQNSTEKIMNYVDHERIAEIEGGIRGNIDIGFNGESNGEPHLVFILNNSLAKYTLFEPQSIMMQLRRLVCSLGQKYTFDLKTFPMGINVNVGLLLDNVMYMSTHERNLVSGRKECIKSSQKNGICSCNTLACGTGGAAVFNAYAKYHECNSSLQTIHPGGIIEYSKSEKDTIMIGPTRKGVIEESFWDNSIKFDNIKTSLTLEF